MHGDRKAKGIWQTMIGNARVRACEVGFTTESVSESSFTCAPTSVDMQLCLK